MLFRNNTFHKKMLFGNNTFPYFLLFGNNIISNYEGFSSTITKYFSRLKKLNRFEPKYFQKIFVFLPHP